jgi:hypothetical protein
MEPFMPEHIRIGDVAPRVHYVADGVQSAFTYPFPIFEADDLKVHLDGAPLGYGFTVEGAGRSEGGTLRFAAAPASGTRVTLRRRVAIARVSDFQPNGVLRAATLNDELDRQVAVLQEVRDEVSSAIRLDPSEPPTGMVLPPRAARADKLLGFDAMGNVSALARGGSILAAFPGAVPRSVEDKLGETLSARDFGAVGNGVADDGPALQAAMNAAAAAGKHLIIGEGTHRTTMPLLLGGAAAGLTMRGAILYAGGAGLPALTIGDGGAVRNAPSSTRGLRVVRATVSDWQNHGDIGLVLRNLDASSWRSAGRGLHHRRPHDGRGARLRGQRAASGPHHQQPHRPRRALRHRRGLEHLVRYHGGHFACASALHPNKDRFGVRFSAAPGPMWRTTATSSSARPSSCRAQPPIAGIPFLSEVSSRSVVAYAVRMEACSPFVARHTSNAQDHLYEVSWASQGYLVDVDYAPTSNRVGAVVRGMHQAAAHREFTRDVANIPNLRASAFRWTATQTGFERLACLSTNVGGSPTALAQFAFPGLEDFILTDRGVVLPGGRGLGFVVDARRCKEFALAVDADDPRLVVQCFDGAMNLLTEAAGQMARASGMSLAWNAATRWWQGAADMTDADLTRLQVIRLAPAWPMPSSASRASTATTRCAPCASPPTRRSRRRCCSACPTCRTARASCAASWPGTRPPSRAAPRRSSTCRWRARVRATPARPASPWPPRASSSWPRWARPTW